MKRKPPTMPIWYWLDTDNCWFLKIIKNNYMPNSVRVTCPVCYSIFEFDPAIDCNKEEFKTYKDGQQYIERTVCHKSFIVERNYSW